MKRQPTWGGIAVLTVLALFFVAGAYQASLFDAFWLPIQFFFPSFGSYSSSSDSSSSADSTSTSSGSPCACCGTNICGSCNPNAADGNCGSLAKTPVDECDACSGVSTSASVSSDDGECTTDADCDDGILCTGDACVDVVGPFGEPTTVCEHILSDTDCVCEADADCNDSDACTADVCGAGGRCFHYESDCTSCETDADCSGDGSACSFPQCLGGTCAIGTIDCDDKNPCTADSCDSLYFDCINEPDESMCNDGSGCTKDSCVSLDAENYECSNIPQCPKGTKCTTIGGEEKCAIETCDLSGGTQENCGERKDGVTVCCAKGRCGKAASGDPICK